jgi:hypothetical protein
MLRLNLSAAITCECFATKSLSLCLIKSDFRFDETLLLFTETESAIVGCDLRYSAKKRIFHTINFRPLLSDVFLYASDGISSRYIVHYFHFFHSLAYSENCISYCAARTTL